MESYTSLQKAALTLAHAIIEEVKSVKHTAA